jgi:hypothetical protein
MVFTKLLKKIFEYISMGNKVVSEGKNITKDFNSEKIANIKVGKEITTINQSKTYTIVECNKKSNGKSNGKFKNYVKIFNQNKRLNNIKGDPLYKQVIILYNFNLLFEYNPKLKELFDSININIDDNKIPKEIKKVANENSEGKYSGNFKKMYILLLELYTSKKEVENIQDPKQKEIVKEFLALLNDEYEYGQFDDIYKSYYVLSKKQQEELKAYVQKYKKEKEVNKNNKGNKYLGKTSPLEAFLKNPDVSDEEKKNASAMIDILIKPQNINGMKLPMGGARKFIKNKLYLFVLDSNVINLFNPFYGIGKGKNESLNLGRNRPTYKSYYGKIRNNTTVGYKKKCIINLLLSYDFTTLKNNIDANNLTTNQKLIVILLSMMYEFNKIILVKVKKVKKNKKTSNNSAN